MLAWTLAALMVAGLGIDARTDCPSADQVARELRELLGDAASAATGENLEVWRDGEALHVRLGDAHGSLAERTLPGNDCVELARAVAVLVAAWRTDVGASSPRLELRRTRSPVDLGWDLGAGFSASLASSPFGFAPGGTLALTLGPRRGRVLARLALTANDLRTLAVGTSTQGQARYTRAGLAAGPSVRFRPGRFLFDLFAELSVGLVYVDAVGFSSTQSAFGFDVGLGGGARAAIHVGPVAPFLAARLVGWLTPQSVLVAGPNGGISELPRLEVLLEAGIALGRY
jgi:hypothetical protein